MKRPKFIAVVGGGNLLHFNKSKLASHMNKSWQHGESRAIKFFTTRRKSWRVAGANRRDHALVKNHIAALNDGLARHGRINARVHQGHRFLLRLGWNLVALCGHDRRQTESTNKSKNYFCCADHLLTSSKRIFHPSLEPPQPQSPGPMLSGSRPRRT